MGIGVRKAWGYGALAAAVALACGTSFAQDREEALEERIEAADQIADAQRDAAEAAERELERELDVRDVDTEVGDVDVDVDVERDDAVDIDADDRRLASDDDADALDAEDADEADELDARREELLQDADNALAELRETNERAASLMDEAYGSAVFDTTKGGFLVTGAGGTGVARPRSGGQPIFMHLGQAGVGLSAGLQQYQLVFLFEDETTYINFVSGQWDGNIAAQAAAGEEGVSEEETFVEGISTYRLTDSGLIAGVDVSGTRFWPSERLNDPDALDALQEEEAQLADNDTFDTGPSHPERLDDIAAEHSDLSTFIAAVKSVGLADALTGTTPYTVFAPTDEAFAADTTFDRESMLAPENREELLQLLRAHIVADDVSTEMARNIPEARTIDGGTVALGVDDDRLVVGDAAVLEQDIEDGQLRIYPIDHVLPVGTRVATAETSDLDDDESRTEDAGQDDPDR